MLEGFALLLLAVAALCFQRSATAPWAEARAGDGRRIQVSPIGLTDFGSGATAPAECRWWPKLGNQELCAVNADATRDVSVLRRTYPLVVIALWTAVLAIFLNALRIPRVPRAVGVSVAFSLPILAVLAYRGIFIAAPRALSVLSVLSLSPASAGFAAIAAAAVSSTVAVVLLVLSGRLRGN